MHSSGFHLLTLRNQKFGYPKTFICHRTQNYFFSLELPCFQPKPIFCENNLTVFQNRYDGKLLFNRTWNEYKNGFGNVIRFDSNAKICLPGEFWLGNDILSKLSNEVESMLRVRFYLSKLFNL